MSMIGCQVCIKEIVVAASYIFMCMCSLSFLEKIEPDYETRLDANNIGYLLRPSRTDEEQELIDEIYDDLKKFRRCHCSNCVSDWLVNLVQDSQLKDSSYVQQKISQMINRLDEFYDGYINLCDSSHVNCFSENAIHKWINSVVYERLDRVGCSEDDSNTVRFVFGEFKLNGIPV